MTINQIWNEIPCVQLPWYHRLWIEVILGTGWFVIACAGGAIAMIMLITAPIWFPFWIYYHK